MIIAIMTRESGRPTRSIKSASIARYLVVALAAASVTASQNATERLPVPVGDDASQVVAEVREVFRKDYATANTPAERSAFAKALASLAHKNANPLERWGMLTEAGRLAADAGDVETAFEVIGSLNDGYDIDRMELELATIAWMAMRATPSVARDLAKRTMVIGKTLVSEQAFAEAKQLTDIMSKLLVKAGDRELSAEFREFNRSVDLQMKSAEERAKKEQAFRRKLAQMQQIAVESVGDPQKSLEAGIFFCFEVLDWNTGLPLLALGSDTELSGVAQCDLEAKDNIHKLYEASNRWVLWGEKQKNAWKAPALDRSILILTNITTVVTGLDKIRIETRINEIQEIRAKVQDVRKRDFDHDAFVYITAVEAADRSPLEPAVKKAIGDFVVGLKVDGLWSSIGSATILCGAKTVSGAFVPLKGAAPTGHNWSSDMYDRKAGLIGSPLALAYIDTNRASSKDSQDDFHVAAFATSGVVSAKSSYFIGAKTSASTFRMAGCAMWGQAESAAATTTPLSPGLYALSRHSPLAFDYVKASGPKTTVAIKSAAPAILKSNHYVFCFSNPDGTPSSHTDARLSFYSLGSSLDLALLNARVASFMAAMQAALR